MYTSVLHRSMPFTKAQRLKGLKKQLRNLGYDVVSSGGSISESEPESSSSDGEMDPELEKRARKQIIAWDNAKSVEQF